MDRPTADNKPDWKPQRSILVTGAHRSGTTWVGKMLAANDQIGYISEPLNVWHRSGVMRVPVKHWYTYICEDNEGIYGKAIEETVSFQYHTKKEIQSLKSIKDFLRMVRACIAQGPFRSIFLFMVFQAFGFRHNNNRTTPCCDCQ